jgi:putative radical SAM enzyme (TIGR03279 family)
MSPTIKSIEKDTPAYGRKIKPGDVLARINGFIIQDVLDYKYHAYDARLLLELHEPDGRLKFVRIHKPEGAELGLVFDSYLMDKPRACRNKCVFCFVDQLPRGMRKSLYFKDDDIRLSFLLGNYVTLTNLDDREVERIARMRLSPLNISVHSTEPELHQKLLGIRKNDNTLQVMKRFRDAGITMNCQIVCCPGLNDGEHLQKTMSDLASMYPAVKSVSVVPVGLTKHRERLAELKPFDFDTALRTLYQTETFGDGCMQKLGTRFVWPADELYLKARLDIPPDGFYEDYPQLGNGVGMLRLLLAEVREALRSCTDADGVPFAIATGCAAADYLQKIIVLIREKCANIIGKVVAVRNDFFGETVDVAGLVTGGDLIAQLQGRDLGKRLLITRNMLRSGETVFLDNISLQEVESALGVPIRVVEPDGADLVRAVCGK